MSDSSERRVHERWNIHVAAAVVAGDGSSACVLEDVSVGGALLKGDVSLQRGDGIRLAFKLPNGMPVTANGRVARLVTDGPRVVGAGIQFYGLDDVTLEILRQYFSSAEPSARPSVTPTLEEKFRIETDRDERVYVSLVGFLARVECENLRSSIDEAVRQLRGTGVRLCINARDYQCCSPDAVDFFRRCFSELKQRDWVVGALVGPKSVGMMQMRRAVRDANVADAFVSFDEVEEALEFLEMARP